MFRFKLIAVLLFQLCVTDLFADNKPVELYYIKDKAKQYNVEDIKNLYEQHKLKKEIHSLNFGFEASDVWVRINFDSSRVDKILTIQNAHLDSIALYIFSGDKLIDKRYSGDHLDFNSRYINSNFFNFLVPKNATSVYLKIHTDGPMLVPVEILTHRDYFKFFLQSGIILWIYLGFILLIFISNIILYIWLKESINLYYSLFLLSIGTLTALDFGYTFQYLWPHKPLLNQYIPFIYLLIFVSILFTEKLLNIKRHSPFLYKIFQFLYLCSFFSGVTMIFSSYRTSTQIIFYFTFFIPLISFTSGIYLYSKLKNELSWFFLIGWSAFMSCILIYMISLSGAIQFNWIIGNIIQIGSIVEIIFFNMAIFSRIYALKTEKKELMEERSQELIKINMKLRFRNERLEQYTSIINHNLRGPVATLLGLCNIYNRSAESDPDNRMVFDKVKETTLKIDTITKDLNLLLDLRENVESEIQPVDLEQIFKNAIIFLDRDIENSGAIITYDFSIISKINAYQEYIKDIFYQLINNSIKFRRENIQPEINIRSDEDESYVFLIFKDNGLGIDLVKYKEDIFNPFKKFQLHIEGKGLGLYVIKREIEAMGGSIDITSQLDQGSVFTVKLNK